MNTNICLTPRIAAIMGALVADAAALGLHWLYDPSRIAQIEKIKGLVFLPPDVENFADVKGFFAHGNKLAGDSSGYGEACLLMLNHFATHGEFKRIEYQTEFRSLFGPGGAYTGYIDSPTRQTLLKLIPYAPEDFPEVSGADDDQFAALATVPVIAALYSGTQDNLLEKIETVVRLTNNNEDAVVAAKFGASVIASVLQGKQIKEALTQALPHAGEKLRPLLNEAMQSTSLNSVHAAERFGSACHVLEGVPVVTHIVLHAESYQHAIEANIRAGGDSCGRAILLGAIVAAHTAQKQMDNAAIPLAWLAKYNKLSHAADACTRFSSCSTR